MPNLPIHVYIVDDEPSVCTSCARLVRSAGMQPLTFPSVEEFLRSDFSDENACVISDIQMPGISGLELPSLLARAGHHLPVIFFSGQDMGDRARSAGGAAFFRKPVDDQALLDGIARAISGSRAA